MATVVIVECGRPVLGTREEEDTGGRRHRDGDDRDR